MDEPRKDATVGVPTATASVSAIAPIIKSGTAISTRTGNGTAVVERHMSYADKLRGIAGLRTIHVLPLTPFSRAIWITDEHGNLRDAGISLNDERDSDV